MAKKLDDIKKEISSAEKRLISLKKLEEEELRKSTVKCMKHKPITLPDTEFWKFVKKCSDEVRKWPDWKKGPELLRLEKEPKNGCGAELKISELEYIQTHWYVGPYSCTGGDYWNEGEGKFRCPKCGYLNRLYQRPEVEKLKRFFKSVKDTYRD